MSTAVGNDDYGLTRVPASARFHWFSLAMQRFGQMSTLTRFLIGATLGFGMGFWDVVICFALGSVILELVAILVGIAGQREGLSTSVLARWTGFGGGGASIIGLAIGIASIGWVGVQNGVAANGLAALMPALPAWAWSLVFGLIVTAIVMFGIRWMAWVAYLSVPAFLLLAGWSVIVELSDHSLGELIAATPAGPPMSIMEGTAVVAGSTMVGAVIAPDMTRFNRSAADVVKQSVVGFTLGEFVIGVVGALLALALQTSEIGTIVTSTSGVIGTVVIVASTIKINDWNLYGASLALVNFVESTFGRRVSRTTVTLVAGVAGSLIAAVGIADGLAGFATILSVAFPPIAGIMVADYFVVRTHRAMLADRGAMPTSAPAWVPVTLGVWLVASLAGQFTPTGLGSVVSLGVAFILYVALGRLGLLRQIGTRATETPEARSTARA